MQMRSIIVTIAPNEENGNTHPVSAESIFANGRALLTPVKMAEMSFECVSSTSANPALPVFCLLIDDCSISDAFSSLTPTLPKQFLKYLEIHIDKLQRDLPIAGSQHNLVIRDRSIIACVCVRPPFWLGRGFGFFESRGRGIGETDVGV
jgi:hypothetical protein